MILVPLPLFAVAVERVRSPLQLEEAKSRGHEPNGPPAAQIGVLFAVFVEVQRSPQSVARAAHYQHDSTRHVEERSHSASAYY